MRYLAKLGDPYDKVGFDENGRVAIDWGVTGVPETFVIDAKDNIIARYEGALTESDAHRLVDKLLQTAP